MWQLSDDNLVAAWQPLPRVTQLKDLNPFPRENRIEFREHDHKYFVDGALVPRSVTGLLHEFSSPFNPARALASMKRGRDWETKRQEMEAQGLGISDDDILARWSRNGAVQSKHGQLLPDYRYLSNNLIEIWVVAALNASSVQHNFPHFLNVQKN